MSFIRFEQESQCHAIERFCEAIIKKGKPLEVTGYLIQAGHTEKSATERISRKRKIIIFDEMIGQINIPLLPKKETVILKLD